MSNNEPGNCTDFIRPPNKLKFMLFPNSTTTAVECSLSAVGQW